MLKVVLADDEKKICQLLQIIVDWKKLGFEIVEVVHNGRDALEAVQRHQPDVIVTDIRMPECSGLELLHRVREEKQDIDVVIISGYRQFEYAHTALQDGAEDYLLKPIKKAELTAVLERIRARRQSRGEIQEKLEQMEDIQRSLEISTEKLQDQMMLEIISGKLQQISLEKLNEDYRCGFSGDARYFIVYKVDFDELVQEKTEEVVGRKLLDTVRRMFAQNDYRSCCVCHKNLICCLADGGAEMQELEHLLYHSIREMLDYAGQLTEIHVTVGIVRVEGDGFHEAFCRSVQAVRDQILAGTERVLRYRRPAVGTNDTELPAWNLLDLCPVAPDELNFFDEMIERVCAAHNIDRTRIYATGHSLGSLMTQYLGLARPDVFAAIAPCSGVLFTNAINVFPNKPAVQKRPDVQLPVWMFGGENEEWLLPAVPAVENSTGQSINYWRELNHVPGEPVEDFEAYRTDRGRWKDYVFAAENVPMVRYTWVEEMPHATMTEMSFRIWDEFFRYISKTDRCEVQLNS